ncbi:MAG: hypothetical protein HOP17_12770 [Acidobacteria bacterium]|nr:hypothetical protein [Acidobacteriota bacterium]
MQEYNVSPYQNQTDSLSNIPVTPLMIEYLRATKPWVRFMSVISFILAGLMVLGGLVMIVLPAGPGMERFGLGPMIGIIYILLAGLYVAPAYFLHQFASSIGNLMRGGGDVAMEAALGSQKSFWRFVGIMTLVVMVIYVLIFVFAILFGIMSAAGRMNL